MKTRIKTNCAIVAIMAVAAFALGVFACQPALEPYQTGTEAELRGLIINTAVGGNISVETIPAAIDSFDWDDEDFDVTNEAFETAALNRPSDTVNARFWPQVSRGARVEWGIGNLNTVPFKFSDIRVPANFNSEDFLYFRVTSENGEITQYYRFYAWVRSPVIDMASVHIGEYRTRTEIQPDPDKPGANIEVEVVELDDRMFATIAAGGSTWNLAQMGSIFIRKDQATNAEVVAVPFDDSSNLRYAVTRSSSEAPNFETNKKFTFTAGTNTDYLYIEVVAQNEVDIAIYRFRVNVGRIATIKTLMFGDYEVVGKGVPNTNWGDMAPGNFETADQPAGGFPIDIVLDDPAATAQWVMITGSPTTAPSFFDSPNDVLFTGSNALAIKVVSEIGNVTRYYRINVTLLAAVFLAQPKSDYYYYYDANTTIGPGIDKDTNAAIADSTLNWYEYAKLKTYVLDEDKNPTTEVEKDVDPTHQNFTIKGESTIQPLSVTLDRTGSFTYQWYEANSWYGGYGFDAEGRILYYLPGRSDYVIEQGFNENFNQSDTKEKQLSEYFVKGFDEKKNVSLHNGGNQFYRMEYPGREIPGATSSTYTPKIDYRPFIDGYTSETHYYWVVVTDETGRTATSKRAVIVSERDPTKKHCIVDVNYDLWEEDGDGNKIVHPARNPSAFTYMRQPRLIPIALPDDFDVNDYTVATAQAIFFLKDGTPWIQNWTQGDVGFYKGTDRLIIYYNLTNNNATLSLVGGGKEPQGASLTETPTHVVLKPAGEKPVNDLPPFLNTFDAWGRPIPDSSPENAQGWFTAYIELVELRFEGPARAPVEP